MKRKIITLALSVLLVLGAAAVLAACDAASAASDNVKEIITTQQASGNVRYTNYQVVVNADVDWNNLSDAEKQKIIDYGFKESHKQAAENDVNNYNVLGIREGSTTVLFMWDRANEQAIIFKDGQPTGTTLPAPSE